MGSPKEGLDLKATDARGFYGVIAFSVLPRLTAARLASASARSSEPFSAFRSPGPVTAAVWSSTALGCWSDVLERLRAAELAALTTTVTPSFAG